MSAVSDFLNEPEMTPNEDKKQATITQTTTISIALVVSMCMGAFWTGGQLTKLTVRVDNLKATQMELKELTKEITEMTRTNKARIELLQNK